MNVTRAMIDPELRRNGAIMGTLLRLQTPAAFRRLDRLGRWMLIGRKPKQLKATESWIARRDGGRLRLMIYASPQSTAQNRPVLLWIHGGGYLMGTPEQDVATYERLIIAADCVIVAPDYRLALEAPYPAALDDCYDALLWTQQRATELGARDDQIAVGGMSAGGGLTAALSLYARDRGEVRIAFQLPLYPMIDDRMRNASAIGNDAPIWNSVSNALAWSLYLGPLHGSEGVPAYAAAARATDYRGLPPTCTFVGDLEPFRDETLAYVEALRKADVPVAFELFHGAYHGFDVIVPKAAISRRATQFFVEWFKFAARHHYAAQP